MIKSWKHSAKIGLGALALTLVSWAGAQTTSATDAPSAPVQQLENAKPKHPGAHKHHRKHHHKHHSKRHDPSQREAAAAHQQSRKGGLGSNESLDQYQRNALARCEVFKSPEDRHACAERVRQPGQGSVEGGGIIREYTQQVRVPQ